MKSNRKSRFWAFVMYPDSMPSNWLSILSNYHLPMAVSPIHSKDINADGEEKKAHYHVLVAYGNTTTSTVIQEISDSVNGTIVIPVVSCKGYYRYLTHKDNPEKKKYNENEIIHISGFSPADYWDYTSEEEYKLKFSIQKFIADNEIYEYWDLTIMLMTFDIQMYDYCTRHPQLFNTMVTSYRNKYCNRKKI